MHIIIVYIVNILLDLFHIQSLCQYILGTLAVLWSTICSNQDIVKTLFDRNPEEFRYVTTMLGPLDLPEDFKANSFDLSYFCKRREESDNMQNSNNLLTEGWF